MRYVVFLHNVTKFTYYYIHRRVPLSEQELFRQKSLDKISSPEQLNDYITVTNPGVWMLLTSIVLVLFGAIVWGTFGKLETRIRVPAIVDDSGAVLYVEADDILKIQGDQKVDINGIEGSVVSYGNKGNKASDVLGDIALSESGYSESDILYDVYADIDIQNGIYMAEIVIDSVSPISFLINNKAN